MDSEAEEDPVRAWRGGVGVVVAMVAVGCAGQGPDPKGEAGDGPPATGVVAESGESGRVAAGPTRAGVGCKGTPVFLGEGFPEVQGTAEGAELWGLLFVAKTPLQRGDEVKIVWRMTGEGPLEVRAGLGDGTQAKLVWGPEEHGGSTWRRPGQEWGTGFVFPKAGCWKIELSRTRGSGHVWLPVK